MNYQLKRKKNGNNKEKLKKIFFSDHKRAGKIYFYSYLSYLVKIAWLNEMMLHMF